MKDADFYGLMISSHPPSRNTPAMQSPHATVGNAALFDASHHLMLTYS